MGWAFTGLAWGGIREENSGLPRSALRNSACHVPPPGLARRYHGEMNKLLLLALILVGTLAFLSLRQKKLKFEIEFEMEPKDAEGEAD